MIDSLSVVFATSGEVCALFSTRFCSSSNKEINNHPNSNTIKSDIDYNKICHLITQGLINVKHVTWTLVLKKNLRNIEKKNIAVTLLVIVKINCKMAGKEEGIATLSLQSILLIY